MCCVLRLYAPKAGMGALLNFTNSVAILWAVSGQVSLVGESRGKHWDNCCSVSQLMCFGYDSFQQKRKLRIFISNTFNPAKSDAEDGEGTVASWELRVEGRLLEDVSEEWEFASLQGLRSHWQNLSLSIVYWKLPWVKQATIIGKTTMESLQVYWSLAINTECYLSGKIEGGVSS